MTFGRSGSTALTNLLNAIPGYCIRGENGGALNALAQAAHVVRDSHDRFGHLADGPDTPWFGIDTLDPDAFAASLAAAFTNDVLCPPPGTRVTGFKEIRYLPEVIDEAGFHHAMRFMLDAFPDARIVFNTRDVEKTLRSGWWKDRDPDTARAQLNEATRWYRQFHAREPRRTFLIDHADYDGKPEGFAPLLAWLGEELDEAQIAAIGAKRLQHLQGSGWALDARSARRLMAGLRRKLSAKK
ncbi:sulfotransferase [Croceicoccus sediminis]|uniref:sulfotransferase n=1 Tax=Croceicoccus sediminis TaxID=2571150 RepID=UPI001478E57F|nr:sulfotransferase [Croceicoccus sediminis]